MWAELVEIQSPGSARGFQCKAEGTFASDYAEISASSSSLRVPVRPGIWQRWGCGGGISPVILDMSEILGDKPPLGMNGVGGAYFVTY